ncbi:MAG: GreA/GreB family elongation factor [Parachlamydia sp.]|jgi:transcription elongation factor GreA-like protein/transcription elongation GreA/GreB family factor|nr:GreA/GreB family elongation factor [Parachlamydia sp.]
MGYLKEFLTQINNRDFHKFLVLWEEYVTSEEVDTEEFSQLLKAIKSSDTARHFGQIVETALTLWQTIKNPVESYEILRLLIDLQTTNSPNLVNLVNETLQKYHGNDPKFNERYKLAGLRNKDQFQGAISKYDLISHIHKGNMVFHTGGWGTGEIMEVSFVREHLVIEFENVAGKKDLSFANAFKTLIPLPPQHFLARRFADPDLLEKEGRADAAAIVKLLLHDMGPKTAAEIKDELCELVIPEKDWTKWWQTTRNKLKKDPMVETPDTLKSPFHLRHAELSPEELLKKALDNQNDPDKIVQMTYNFARDTPTALKNEETRNRLQKQLHDLLENPELTRNQHVQIYFLLEQFFNDKKAEESIRDLLQKTTDIEKLVQSIEIVAFKKRALVAIKELRPDWSSVFLSLLFKVSQSQLRDYMIKELNHEPTRKQLEEQIGRLLDNPGLGPEMFVWYFQKIISQEDASLPFQNKEGQGQFFESFFILFYTIENQHEYRELLKKMYGMLSGKRYELVRNMLQGRSLEFTNEFLLLASKCQSLSDHDTKILRSLAEVVHPSLAPAKAKRGQSRFEEEEIWTTEEGYLRTQERIRQIGTVEVVENAREIEAARAHGDLRENSEFKFAQEKRARLQAELKTLSEQLAKARILTPHDIHSDEVGIGGIVEISDKEGKRVIYTILGQWDADPDQNILSLNSKLAQAMVGKKKGETFSFKEEEFRIVKVDPYLK